MAITGANPPRLVIVGSPERPALELTQPEMVIGHSGSAHLIVDDEFVSRRHALVTADASGRVTIHDLKSTGGTFVNDERIDGPRVLRSGDIVRFADLETRFEQTEPPASEDDRATAILDRPTRQMPAILAGDRTAGATAAAAAGTAGAAARQSAAAVTAPPKQTAPAPAPPVRPPPAPPADAGPTVAVLAPLLPAADAQQLIGILAEHGIVTLADIRTAGSLSTIITGADSSAVTLIEAHADLARLSDNVTANAAIIAAGFTSSLAIARAAQATFVTAAAPAMGEAAAAVLQSRAVAMYNALDQLLIGAHLDAATAAGTGYSDSANTAISPEVIERCSCDDCQSAPSPTAYLADLLNYATTRLLAFGQQIGLPYLEDAFHQPFGELPTDCEAVQTLVRQVRICCEVLRGYLAANPPAAVQAPGLRATQASYLLSTYQALLTGLGTSFDELRLARNADPAARSALASRIGLTIDPYGVGHPGDVLDQLLLDPAPAAPAAQALTEANVERIFGLADTTRNPMSDGPVIGDPTGVITRWNLDGVTWGRNTAADGTIYLWLAQPGAGQIDVTAYKDQGLTQLVAFGQLSPPGTGLPASISLAPENNSGLSGTIEVAQAVISTSISLGAIPKLTSWQLAALRADWQAEDHPADGYAAGTSIVPLAGLPAGLSIPPALQAEISYNATAQILICGGVMAPADLAQLLGLPAGGPDFASAVSALYVQSQRPPVIDPDVIGPDDFRVPVPKTAPADPDQPFDLWVSRRSWVDEQLAAIGAITQPAAGGGAVPSFSGMLGWMYATTLTYGTASAAPWAGTTPVTALQSIWENLAQGVTVPQITVQLACDLAMSPEAFNRLMDLWHQDQAAAAQPPGPALTAANWLEVASLLTQAAKTRFHAAWRAEEAALPLTFGSQAFIVSLREPQPGDWPPVLPPNTPYIDPATVPLTGLPEPTAGGTASQLWQARQLQEAQLTSGLRTANENSGFQAMLQQALGDPNAGDPLPVDIDTVAQDLLSPDPALVATATAAVSAQLFLTVSQFQTMMQLRTMDADPNPAGQPTPAQWLGLYAILAGAETRKRLYPQWVTQEHAPPPNGVTYWTALKAAVPPWRASEAQRSQWHAALAQRSGPPIIDPDLIGPADMVNPAATDPAFALWQARSTWAGGLFPAGFPAALAGIDAALLATTGLNGPGLADLAQQAATGTDITARLAQLTLTYDAFTELMTIRALLAGGITPLPTEQRSFLSILTEVTKQRMFPQWQAQEASAGIIAGPDEFALPDAGATPPVLPSWLATAAGRQAWEAALQARAEQQGTVLAAAAANADAAEGATLTQLRDGLVQAAGAPGATLQATADWLTGTLLIDAETGGMVKTTRIEQAIETLQDLMTGLRAGQLGSFDVALTSAPAAISYIFGSGRYDVFAVGPGRALWHKYWDGTWAEWENLGGILTSAPAVTTQAPGTLDVFALGTDDAVWHLAFSGGAWGGWTSLGGPFSQGPAAGSQETESIDVFAVGNDHQLWQLSGSDGSWGNWQPAARTAPVPAGGITSAPSVVASGTGRYDVFAQGADSHLWHAWLTGTWSGWQDLGGALTSAPSATAVNGPLQAFARQSDNAIWSLTAQPGGSFTGSQWTSLGGYATEGPGALAANNVFTVGTAGILYHQWLDASGWHDWQTTTALGFDPATAPNFDAEWTWMGSYATWRAAILVFLYPENILDPTLREQLTPGFQQLMSNVQASSSLTAAQAAQFAAAYDGYYRDVCSLTVAVSCTAPPVPPGSLLYMFGIAANSGTAYWSSYDAAGQSGYAQTFWTAVPGLSGTQLASLGAATSLIDQGGTLWVLLVVVETTPSGSALAVLRYSTSGDGSWDSAGPYPLEVPPGWISFTAQLGYQGNPQHQEQLGENTAQYPPYIVVTLPDTSQYEQQLNADGTGWAAGGAWVRVGSWEPWTQLTQAQVISGQQIVAVSRMPGQIDLFWVNYSADGSENTVSSAPANLAINGGALSGAFQVDNSFSTWKISNVPGNLRGNYQTALATAARSGTHMDLFVLAEAGLPWAAGDFVPGSGDQGSNDVWWSWWDANLDAGQWQSFVRISSGTPGDTVNLLSSGSYVNYQIAAVARGDALHVFVITDDGQLHTTWTDGLPVPGDTWQTPWSSISLPAAASGNKAAQLTAISPDDELLVDVTVTDPAGNVFGFRWTDGDPWTTPHWFSVNPGVTPSGGTSGAVVAEVGPVAADDDFFYLGQVPAGQPAPVLTSRIDYFSGGAQPAVSPLALGGVLHSAAPVAPIAAVARPGRAEVYVAGPASTGSAIWSRSTSDPASTAAWSAWTPISDDGSDIGTIQSPWWVAAVSQQPQRTDLYVALYGGAGGEGGIYSTYWQDVDFGTGGPALSPFPVPVVSSPLDIPAQLSSSDLQQRAAAIAAAFAANSAAPQSTLAYLQEAYYFVPVYLANQLVQQGQFTAALDWYRTVYDYGVPEQIRDIYYGLVAEEHLPPLFTRPANWLLDPLNPHVIALTRRDAYTRYTVLQIVQCLYAYADSLFTTDTSESDAQARTLYMTGLSLLGLDIFAPGDNPCEGLLIQVMDTPVDPDWEPLLSGLADDLALIGNPFVLTGLVPKVTGALAAQGTWPARFAAARDLIAAARRGLPAAPTVGGVLSSGAALTATAYSALLSVPAVDAAAIAVSSATAAALTPATAAAQADGPQPELKPAPHPAPLPGPQLPGPQLPGPQLPGGWLKLPVVDFWFCSPANPVVSSLLLTGQTRLYQLRHGMNIAGQARQLDPYSAPADAGSGLPAIGAGGQLDVQAPVTQQPTPYPYATLIARAQSLVAVAQGIEAQMLAALQQRDQDLYDQLQASQNLTVAGATVQLQALGVQQAAASVTLATLQQQSAQLQASHWQQMLGSGIGSLELNAITALKTQKDLQATAAVVTTASGIVETIASLGAAAPSAAVASLTAAAGVAATSAQIDNAQASYEAQQADWQFQYSLSQANVQIAGQQITIAGDQQLVAGQQLAISQLQAGNAADTVNFLANKFTNAALYDWMASVLQGVYSFFLQQATAIARQAEDQLAFERQQLPAGYIKASYWQPASANLLAASTPSNTMGLTGAEQLSEDITQLDQAAFSTDQRKLQLTKTISLAQLYPVEFQQLRETGLMNFSTPLTMFDQDYPGHYLRLIQQVSTSVIALIPPGQNINAILSCTGVSQAVIGPAVFQAVTVRTDPQSAAITTPIGATGVFSQDAQPDLLLPFQELGVAAQWQFSMPLAGNRFDFSTLADVQLTLSYTALADPGYRDQVIRSLAGQVSLERPYSFVSDLPDQWYDLNNPDQTPAPMTVEFDVAAADFPPSLTGIEIGQVVLYFALAAGQSFEVSVSALQFFAAGSPAPVGGAATTTGGIISTRRGNAASWIPMIGSSPFGTWRLTLPDTAQVRDWFTSQLITDILFDISYTASTPPWPP